MFCGQFLPTSHYVWFLQLLWRVSQQHYPVTVTVFLGFLVFLSNTLQLLWPCFWGFSCFTLPACFWGFSCVSCFSCFSCFSATLSLHVSGVSRVSRVSRVSQQHSPCVFLGFLVFLVFLGNTLPACFRGFSCFSALWFSLAVLTQLAPILSDIIMTSSLLTNHIKF